MPNVAVFIPGIMGSCLGFSGMPVWTECFHDNYERLADNAAILTYNPNRPADAPRILKYRYWKDYPLVGRLGNKDIYGGMLNYLREHPKFGDSGSVLEFPYDWRQSLTRTAVELGAFLDSEPRLKVTGAGAPRLFLITHSMGGLVARVALADGQIRRDIAGLIHIAPPLMGSANAFSSLCGRVDLPFLDSFVRYSWLNRARARQAWFNLTCALSSFPSLHELIPPTHEEFLYSRKGWFNPLAPGRPGVPEELKADACKVHALIQKSIKQLKEPESPQVHTIYGNAPNSTDDRYQVRVVDDRYELVDPIPEHRDYGDGKVTVSSSLYSSLDRTFEGPIVTADHAYMCASKEVHDHLQAIL